MTRIYYSLLSSIAWLITTVCFISLSLELFLFQIADYDVYRVLNISPSDLFILALILTGHYLLLKNLKRHMGVIKKAVGKSRYPKPFILGIAVALCVVYIILPSQFPFWISLVLLLSLVSLYVTLTYFASTPIHKITFLILFSAGVNSSLIFWMHEESNAGRHIGYAQELAERQDTIAENLLVQLADKGKMLSGNINKQDYWEKQWINSPYLSSNYRLTIEDNCAVSGQAHYQPVLTFDKSQAPVYKVFFPENYSINLRLNTNFRKSIYSENLPFKDLNDVDDFQFSVINNNKIVLSNSHAFDPYILGINLPEIGKGEKIELKGFDVLAYRQSKEVFVLIGEPLSEIQVWISNFALFFSLLLVVVILFEVLKLFITKKNIFNSWQELPIQFRIQFILVGTTCLLFFIISSTTFLFLDDNNAAIARERQIFTSENLRNELTEEMDQYDYKLDDFSVSFLAQLADREFCDIDIYSTNGNLINSSYASLFNSSETNFVPSETMNQLKQNQSLIHVEKIYDARSDAAYLRTYFGVYHNDILAGIASVSAFESEIGTSPYIPIVMARLLNVYVLLLLIAWVGGLSLVNILTRPLELLSNRLSNFKLGEQNEKLKWKGDDAIGQLISEYNKMIDEVEATSQELIRRERDGAWTVMAQQIAHEINNKLTPLRLNTQFLSRIVNGLSPEESENIQRITNELVLKIDSLSKTATQFKLFANLETTEIKPVQLNQYIQQYLTVCDRQNDNRYLLHSDNQFHNNPVINIDTHHLQEVLNNIIANAENSIPKTRNGIISIRLKTISDQVIIEIQDNGAGIDPNVLETISDPTFSVTTSQTGLGLPISKKIIEFYNGKLNFETTEGEGTRVFITFPYPKRVVTRQEAEMKVSA